MVATASMYCSNQGMTCPKCGARLIAPEWSDSLNAHRVFNLWSCTICGFCLGEVSRSLKVQTEEPLATTTAA